MQTPTFPFTAVVGADDMALALILTSVSPEVGGVLVRGEKGTAKSTMVRALARVLPSVEVVTDCRFGCDPAAPDGDCPDGPHTDPVAQTRPARLVELPVGASEDRVMGSLHLSKALRDGVTEYEPGLLAAAHRGLLYVDEVNLLHDHLVDALLDSAAMGRATVEREGVSVSHAARFVLVGTMNPEEGELRPQLLDRFGLTVEVSAPRDPQTRVEVVRRRLAFDADPHTFAQDHQGQEEALARRIAAAREALPHVRLGDRALSDIARVCAGFEVDGMRADLVTARAAVAHAAWHGRDQVTRADVRAAALLALPHRRRRNPFDTPGLDEDLLDQLLGDDDGPDDDGPGPSDDNPGGPGDEAEDADLGDSRTNGAEDESERGAEGDDARRGRDWREGEPASPDGWRASSPSVERGPDPSNPDSNNPDSNDPGQARTTTVGTGETYRTRLLAVRGTGTGTSGRRSPAETAAGRTVGSRPARGESGPLHLVGTMRAAAARTGRTGCAVVAGDGATTPTTTDASPRGARITITSDDVRLARRIGRESNLVLFCVDASGSMAARKRMQQVKTAVLSLLLDAYQRRDKIGLVTFRGHDAEVALPPTSSVDVAARRLADLPADGRTPLAEGLLQAAETVRLERLRDPSRRALLVVLTDGRATSGADAVARSLRAADHVASQGIASIVIDCEAGPMRMGLAQGLAARLGAEHLPVGEVGADHLTTAVRGRAG